VALLNGKAVTSSILLQPPEAKTVYQEAAPSQESALHPPAHKICGANVARYRKKQSVCENSANADFQVFA
jgi:hypothetical protein